MKSLFFIVPFALFASAAGAAVITLKDGTRVEGKVEGEMDGVKLIKTKYGTLTIDSKEIANIGTPEVAAEPAKTSDAAPAPVPAVAASTAAPAVPAAAVSTAPAAATPVPAATVSTDTVSASTETAQLPLPEPPPPPRPQPGYTFRSVALSTAASARIYYEDGVILATETFDSKGGLLGLTGSIKDALYREYYDNGNIRTEKNVMNARTSGALKAYYPSGVLQSEANYLEGKLSGAVKIYGENAKLLFEQNFKDGLPNGWFREFDAAGAVRSELFYTDGHPAEKPGHREEKKAEPSDESPLTAKTQQLARGERVTFFLNGKFVAKMQLDKDFNIISKDGKVPDGAVKIYDKDGRMEKEFVFLKNEAVLLRIYGAGGQADEYAYLEGQAAKKGTADGGR